MTPEKRKELLHYAADNPDAKFECMTKPCGMAVGSYTYNIEAVLAEPIHDWEIVKEPVVTIEYYYYRKTDMSGGIFVSTNSENDIWDLRITTTDGVRVAELREEVE